LQTAIYRHCLVGPGRLGSALLRALAGAGHRVTAVGVRPAAGLDAESAPPRLAVADAMRLSLSEAAGRPLVLWLTVPDDAIAAVATDTLSAAGGADLGAVVAVHCSGLMGLQQLAPWRRAGAQVVALHPLQSFTPTAGGTVACPVSDPFAAVPIAVTADTAQAEAAGTALAEAIGGRPFPLREADKPLYHLAAAVASNLLVALQSQAGELMRQATHKGSVTDALQLLAPLVRTSLENSLSLGPERALTGPVARGDAGTVRAHLALLAHEPARLGDSYCSLSQQALALAAPRLDNETVQTMQRLLGGYPDQAVEACAEKAIEAGPEPSTEAAAEPQP
jgi:predicted short-subunit dehydrogenase-like oxidoreductase (DUF2520 family)